MALCTVTQNLCYVLHMEAETMMKFLTLYIPSHRTLRQVGFVTPLVTGMVMALELLTESKRALRDH